MSKTPNIAPVRFLDLVREDEQDNERISSWIQLGMLAFLSTLYCLGRRPGAGLEPTLIVLLSYTPIAILRLVLAYLRKLAVWMLYVSIVIDVIAIETLLWSYQFQYQQPLAFSLKSPGFTYLFVFIALRALRYDARYVLVAGLSAIIGWGSLLAYALRTGAETTRDYAQYVSGNYLNVGAELDKMICLWVVTGVLAYAVGRSRRLLLRAAIVERQAAQPAPQEEPVAAEAVPSGPVTAPPAAPVPVVRTGTFRNACVLSIGVRGFSKAAAMLSDEERGELLADYRGRVASVVAKHRGALEKTDGDALIAHFGVGTETATAAADALSTMDALLAVTDEWGRERAAKKLVTLRFDFAAAAGNLMPGETGGLSVIGEAVNLASTLEKHNRKLHSRAITTRQTLELACSQGYRFDSYVRALSKEKVDGLAYQVDLIILSNDPGDASDLSSKAA